MSPTFRSLRNPNYRRYAVGGVVSNTGTWMQRVAQDWLVLQLTGSGAAIGITTGLQFLPFLLLSPLAVFFSDVVEMVGVLLSILMYMTPVIYPMEILKDSRFLPLVRFNPIRSILEVFRDPIYQSEVPPLTHFSVCLGIALAALAIGAYAFRRSSDRIPFYI